MPDLRPLSGPEIREALRGLPGWELRGEKLFREYRFPDFRSAWDFMSSCAQLAHTLNHHPDWSNAYSRVTIVLWTHSAGGVTDLDLKMARQFEELAHRNISRLTGRDEEIRIPMNPCQSLRRAGTAVWLDQLGRELLQSGRIQELISTAAMSGLTSNPAIFHKAMTTGTAYDGQIRELAGSNLHTEQLYEHLAVRDIQMTCDLLRPVWEETRGGDGYVSLEVSPHLARDREGTVAAAKRLNAWVNRPNLLIKVPGTPEGLPAIEQLLGEGIGINVTLLFSVDAYEEVARTFLRALGDRAGEGKNTDIPSVASFFISRIDTLLDKMLEKAAERAAGSAARNEILTLKGKAAVANARIAYESFHRLFRGPDFAALQAGGARPQRPLWASTSAKNPAYRDVLYVEPLIGRDTVNTMPMETLEAFLDHGVVVPDSITHGMEEAHALLRRIEGLGISFRQVTDQLLDEGIAKFNEPYDQLLSALEERRQSISRGL